MFHGLTMVNFDGQTQNQMMVRPWSTMVNHGQPWSDGQTVAGVECQTAKPRIKHPWWSELFTCKMFLECKVIETRLRSALILSSPN